MRVSGGGEVNLVLHASHACQSTVLVREQLLDSNHHRTEGSTASGQLWGAVE